MLVCLSGALAGCAQPESEIEHRDATTLVDGAGWQLADPADDPFNDHEPTDRFCLSGGFGPEGRGLEVDTGRCNYPVLSQPAKVPVFAGDVVHIDAFHNDLAAEQPAIAHIAVALGGEVLWDAEVDIPSAATPYTVAVQVQSDFDAGEPVIFHVHNHGANTYRLVSLMVEPGQ